MTEIDSFDDFMDRIRKGDADIVAEEVFRRFVRRLTGLCREKLDTKVIVIEDPEGVADSVLKSFVRRYDYESPPAASGWEKLWSLLATIAVRKCYNLNAKWLGEGRNLQIERPWPKPDNSAESLAFWEPVWRDPTDPLIEEMIKLLRGLMKRLKKERDRLILQLRLQGCTKKQICEELHKQGRGLACSESTIKRRLDKWTQELRADLLGNVPD